MSKRQLALLCVVNLVSLLIGRGLVPLLPVYAVVLISSSLSVLRLPLLLAASVLWHFWGLEAFAQVVATPAGWHWRPIWCPRNPWARRCRYSSPWDTSVALSDLLWQGT
jgi:hypothetical protein